jgi:hypothetical protein
LSVAVSGGYLARSPMGQELLPAFRRSRARSESFPVSRRRWLQPERSWQKRGQRSRRPRHSVLQGTLAGCALATSWLQVRRRRPSSKAAESPSRTNPFAPTTTAVTRFSARLRRLPRPGGQIHPRAPPPRPRPVSLAEKRGFVRPDWCKPVQAPRDATPGHAFNSERRVHRGPGDHLLRCSHGDHLNCVPQGPPPGLHVHRVTSHPPKMLRLIGSV